MSRNREAGCCEYREEMRRLALKRSRKKTKGSKRDSSNNRIDDCNEDDDQEIEEKRKCEEKRGHGIEKLSKLISLEEEIMGRIKPSIGERDKYSMDSRHIRCFLEASQIEKLEFEEKMLKISMREPCDSDPNKKKKKTKATQGPLDEKQEDEDKKDEEGSKDVADQQGVNDESGPEIDEQMERSEPKKGREKHSKGEFWCPEVKKKVDTKLQDHRQDEDDCKDSICSFDSQINLSGLALTKKEMQKIAETRRSRMISPAVESKKTTE